MESGVAWSWPVPEDLQGRAYINLLEFIMQVAQIWFDCIKVECKEELYPCHGRQYLCYWMATQIKFYRKIRRESRIKPGMDRKAKHHTKFLPKSSWVPMPVFTLSGLLEARMFAVTASHMIAFYFLPPAPEHKNFLTSFAHLQTPANISIKALLPDKIVSFISSTLLLLSTLKQ